MGDGVMKKAVKLLVSVCFSLAIMMSMCSYDIHAAEDDNVELYYAKKNYFYSKGLWNVNGKIAVRNLGYQKNVVVHYTYDNKIWYDVSASYLKASSDGYEVWSFETPMESLSVPNSKFRFAIKYEVNGDTYWDNNNGKDYYFELYYGGMYQTILNKSNLILYTCRMYDDRLDGTIFTKSINTNKKIIIRYTTDNWNTYEDIEAIKGLDKNDKYEFWNFRIPTTADKCEFAIMCNVNGVTYWDNNFGHNYIYHSPSNS